MLLRFRQVALVAVMLAGLTVSAHADIEHLGSAFEYIVKGPEATQLGETGVFKDYQFESLGYRRDVRIYVPPNYDPAKPIGILFGFHGYLGDVKTEPFLQELWDIEPYAEKSYVITVSLALPYLPQSHGWVGGWDHDDNGLANRDVRAVSDLLRTLKAHYKIDEDRIFSTGHSNGGGFCFTAAHNLPGVFAAVAPEAPVMGSYLPTQANPFAVCAYGGTEDEFGTADRVRRAQIELADKPLEAEFYVYKQTHEPPGNTDHNIAPPMSHNEKLIEFMNQHPKGFQAYGTAPRDPAEPFKDGFDGGEVPSAKIWRVETFDRNGVLGETAGQRFSLTDSRLVNWPMSHQFEGGLVRTAGFFGSDDLSFAVDFRLESPTPGTVVVPLWIQDTHGEVEALTLSDNRWQQRAYPTGRQFRMAGQGAGLVQAERPVPSSSGVRMVPRRRVIRTEPQGLGGLINQALFGQQTQEHVIIEMVPETSPSSGVDFDGDVPMNATTVTPVSLGGTQKSAGAFNLGQRTDYRLRATRTGRSIKWRIEDLAGNRQAEGSFTLPNEGAIRFGFGLMGRDSVVSFDNAEVAEL